MLCKELFEEADSYISFGYNPIGPILSRSDHF